MNTESRKELWLDVLAFTFVIGSAAVTFRGIFQNAELPGWDTPGHYAAFVKMATGLLPNGQLTGYDRDWLGGITLFRFYGPSFFALLAALWHATFKLIPLALLFRIGTFAALMLIPVALWDLARTMFDRRTARWALLLAPAFVFYPKAYASIGIGGGAAFWIGYIPSLAGLAVTFFTLATAVRLRTAPSKKRIAALAALIMLLTTGHTVSFIVFMGLLLVYAASAWRDHAYLQRLGIAVGAGLAASLWWLAPFVAQQALSSTETLSEPFSKSLAILLFPATFPYLWLGAPLLALAAAAGCYLLIRGKKYELPLLLGAVLAAVLLRGVAAVIAPNFTFHYYRLIPFAYILMLLTAGYAFAEAARTWGADAPRRKAYVLLGALLITSIYAFAFDFRADYKAGAENGRGQIGWRWDQFEFSEEAEAFAQRLAALPDAQRVMPLLIPQNAIGNIGSTQFFVSRLALHGGPDIMTGVYTESSPLTPFALSAAEPLTDMKVRFNGDRRLRFLEPFLLQSKAVQLDRLRQLGVDYVFAVDDEVVAVLAAQEGLEEVEGVPPFHLFKVRQPLPLVTSSPKPLVYVDLGHKAAFRDVTATVYAGEATYAVPLIDGGTSLGLLRTLGAENVAGVIVSGNEWEQTRVREAVGAEVPVIVLPADYEVLPRTLHVLRKDWPAGWEALQNEVAAITDDAGAAEGNAASAEWQGDESAVLNGDGPLLVRWGYARGWRVTEGEGAVYQVSPSLLYVSGSGQRTIEHR